MGRSPAAARVTAIERLREVRQGLLAKPELSPVAIGRLEGEALRRCVRCERALRTLEIGLGFGVATLFICEALLENGRGARHVACDPYQLETLPGHDTKFAGAGLRALEEAGVHGLVEFHAEESQLLLPRLLAAGRSFDLAFVDGSHRFENVFLDLVYCGRLVREGGIVFVDDVQLPAVRRALDFCLGELGWTLEEEDAEGPAHEWAVARTRPST